MKKVILEQKEDGSLYTLEGTYLTIVDTLPEAKMESDILPEAKMESNTTFQFIKLGLTVDDIIKLRNNDLL